MYFLTIKNEKLFLLDQQRKQKKNHLNKKKEPQSTIHKYIIQPYNFGV